MGKERGFGKHSASSWLAPRSLPVPPAGKAIGDGATGAATAALRCIGCGLTLRVRFALASRGSNVHRQRLEQLLDAIRTTRIAVIGDYCLDAYWTIDPTGSELSVETASPRTPSAANATAWAAPATCQQPRRPRRRPCAVPRRRRCGPVRPGAGRDPRRPGVNVATCVRRLSSGTRPSTASPTSAMMSCRGSTSARSTRFPPTPSSRYSPGCERPRRRFTPSSSPAASARDQLGRAHRRPERHRGRAADRIFIVDSRHKSARYAGALLKVNDAEAGRLLGVARERTKSFRWKMSTRMPASCTNERAGRCSLRAAARHRRVRRPRTHRRTRHPDSDRGRPGGAGDAPWHRWPPPWPPARVSRKRPNWRHRRRRDGAQLKQCGTASPAEIIELGAVPDYVYRPELADDPRRARYRRIRRSS